MMKKSMLMGIWPGLLLSLIIGCGKMSDEELMEKGNTFVDNELYSKAITNYEIVAQLYPKSPLAPEALFRAGLAYILSSEDFSSASASFQKVVDEYQASPFAEGSQAMVSFLKAVEKPVAADILYQTGLAYTNIIQDFDGAIHVFNQVIEKYPESFAAAPSQFMIGFIYANSASKLEEARLAYDTFLQKYPNHELAPSVQWELKYLGKDINEIPELKNLDVDSEIKANGK
jgi:TolA-binding protein